MSHFQKNCDKIKKPNQQYIHYFLSLLSLFTFTVGMEKGEPVEIHRMYFCFI